MRYKIRQNIWGNWNGYLGTRKIVEFGTRQSDAEAWLYHQQAEALWKRLMDQYGHGAEWESCVEMLAEALKEAKFAKP